MAGFDLTKSLRNWFNDRYDGAPSEDPRRTSQCLTFADATRGARSRDQLSETQQQHIETCEWCARALALAEANLKSAPRAVETSGPGEMLSPEKRARLSKRLKAPQPEPGPESGRKE